MKILLTILFFLSFSPPGSITLIDVKLRKPVQHIDHFSTDHLFTKGFPVPSKDVDSLVSVTEHIAKLIQKGVSCNSTDSFQINQPLVILNTHCEEIKQVSVLLITKIEESRFALNLVKDEKDMRQAQMKLLDFSAYLQK